MTTQEPNEESVGLPTREELQAELLEVPDTVQPPTPDEPASLDYLLTAALRHVKGKRGGDLLAVVLVGSAARRSLTRHSDIDLIAIIKGDDDREEIIRIADRLVEIRYRGQRTVEEEIAYAPRLPPLLRKGRVLFEHDGTGSKLVEKAAHRFRQGPPPTSLYEKIRLKAQCLHWLGKAEDLSGQPAVAQYLLGIFLEDLITGFFRIRGLWLTSPADTLRFISSRDAQLGQLLTQFLSDAPLPERIELARQMTTLLFKDIPQPSRVD